MRPVDRGSIPLDNGGQPKEFRDYRYARRDLIDRLGEYCSYCEMKLGSSLAVEHVKPKKHHPDLELQWSNFLLACANCNPTKGSEDINLDDYYWPDKDNTVRAIEYREGGIVQADPNLSPEQRAKAEATIKLTGLDKIPGNDPKANDPKASDRRWEDRRKIWKKAKRSLCRLQATDSQDMREQIVDSVNSFWSVWMTVFRDYPDMRRRFIEAFPGTSQECFDDDCNAIHRPCGAI